MLVGRRPGRAAQQWRPRHSEGSQRWKRPLPFPPHDGKGVRRVEPPLPPPSKANRALVARLAPSSRASVLQLSEADCGQESGLSCPLPVKQEWQRPKAGIPTHSNLPFGF